MDELDAQLHDRDAGLSRQRPDRVQGPSLRRRRAALRERHAPASADADDRCQPGARAAGAARQGAARRPAGAARRPGRPSRDRRLGGGDRRALPALQEEGVSIAIADAIDNDDLLRLGAAVKDLPLVCAGSGLAIGLPANFGIAASGAAAALPAVQRLSRRRLRQLLRGDAARRWRTSRAAAAPRGASTRSRSARRRDGRARRRARALGRARVGERRRAAGARLQHRGARGGRRRAVGAPATSARASRRCSRRSPGRWSSAARAASSSPAARPRARASRRSACAQLRIGAQIDPGVPWCHAAPALAPDGLHLALKSGNFGGVDFFSRAFAALS